MIKLKNINCYYDDRLTVKGININIEQGEMISIVGPSGCGKTTLLKTICGLHESFEGCVEIEDRDVSKLPAHKRSAILVFQEYLLYPHLTVLGNVGFGLKMQGIKKNEIIKITKPLLERMGLKELINRYPNELSGGQRQRVALARALAVKPKVLLLDEPFSNLDEQLRDDMRQFVCALQKEMGITTVFVTHDIEEALLSSDRIVVMNEGVIQQIDTPRGLYQAPQNYTVGKMLGNRTFIKGQSKDDHFYWLDNKTPHHLIGSGKSADDGISYLMLPTDALSLVYKGSGHIKGRVKKLAYGGMNYEVTLDVQGQNVDLILSASYPIEVGQELYVAIDWSKTLILKQE